MNLKQLIEEINKEFDDYFSKVNEEIIKEKVKELNNIFKSNIKEPVFTASEIVLLQQQEQKRLRYKNFQTQSLTKLLQWIVDEGERRKEFIVRNKLNEIAEIIDLKPKPHLDKERNKIEDITENIKHQMGMALLSRMKDVLDDFHNKILSPIKSYLKEI